MAYNSFTLEELKERFGLRVSERSPLFAAIPPVGVSELLRAELAENTALALAIGTGKARSEMIIAPILVEVRRQLDREIALFSGLDLTVDPERGLAGVVDFLLSLSPEQLTIEAPVIAIVEAKNENFKQGINQCIAEMVAAQHFNAKRNRPIRSVYGAVTTGTIWRFLRLTDNEVAVDPTEYYLVQIETVVGILVGMVGEARGGA